MDCYSISFEQIFLYVRYTVNNRSRNVTVRLRTDGYTDTLTDTNWFYNLSHAVCYSYEADNKKEYFLHRTDITEELLMENSLYWFACREK